MSSEGASQDDAATSPPSPPTLREQLAELVARAVREGDLTLARALLDAQGKASSSTPAGVIELATERAKRGGT